VVALATTACFTFVANKEFDVVANQTGDGTRYAAGRGLVDVVVGRPGSLLRSL